MRVKQWLRDRWPTIRDNATYDAAKWLFLAVIGAVTWVVMRYVLPAISTLSTQDAHLIAVFVTMFIVTATALTYAMVATGAERRLREAGAVHLISPSTETPPAIPNIQYVRCRMVDLYIDDESGQFGSYGSHGSRHTIGATLVFCFSPSTANAVAEVKSVRASITIGEQQVPSAMWLGHFDEVNFPLGGTAELIIGAETSGKTMYIPECRRDLVRRLPPGFLEVPDVFEAKICLFNYNFVKNLTFDVALKPLPSVATLRSDAADSRAV